MMQHGKSRSDLTTDKSLFFSQKVKVLVFFLFLQENVGIHEKRLAKALLMSTVDMFSWRMKKIIT